jgi:hypothetical protein
MLGGASYPAAGVWMKHGQFQAFILFITSESPRVDEDAFNREEPIAAFFPNT